MEELTKTVRNASNDVKKKNHQKPVEEPEQIIAESKPVLPFELTQNKIIADMYATIGDKMEIGNYDGPTCHTFSMMNLKNELIKSIINVLKWEYPSPIQSIGIMPVIDGRDLLCQAQAGTGKTATFMIAALQKIDPNIRNCQIIVLSPGRELAEQTYKVGVQLATYMDVSFSLHIGGRRKPDERGANYVHNVLPNKDGRFTTELYREQIIIATPGRLLMNLEENLIQPRIKLTPKSAKTVSTIKLLIFDEADNILSAGFLESIKNICKRIDTREDKDDEEIKFALYSATLSPEIITMSKNFLRDPVEILVPAEEHVMTNNHKHYAALVHAEEQKMEVLSQIFTTNAGQVIIFCNRKHMVSYINDHVKSLGISVGAINGEMEQSEREVAMEKFRKGIYKVLIGTDIIARGIDTIVDLVINFDIPNIQTQYVHRIGRTGRFGKDGCVINFVVKNDNEDTLKRIYNRYKIRNLDFSLYMKRPSIKI